MFMCVFNSDFQLLGKIDMNNLIILIRHHDQNFAICLLEEKDMLLKNNSSGCSPKARELSQPPLWHPWLSTMTKLPRKAKSLLVSRQRQGSK